jgi:hypothetical protein
MSWLATLGAIATIVIPIALVYAALSFLAARYARHRIDEGAWDASGPRNPSPPPAGFRSPTAWARTGGKMFELVNGAAPGEIATDDAEAETDPDDAEPKRV